MVIVYRVVLHYTTFFIVVKPTYNSLLIFTILLFDVPDYIYVSQFTLADLKEASIFCMLLSNSYFSV